MNGNKPTVKKSTRVEIDPEILELLVLKHFREKGYDACNVEIVCGTKPTGGHGVMEGPDIPYVKSVVVNLSDEQMEIF